MDERDAELVTGLLALGIVASLIALVILMAGWAIAGLLP